MFGDGLGYVLAVLDPGAEHEPGAAILALLDDLLHGGAGDVLEVDRGL